MFPFFLITEEFDIMKPMCPAYAVAVLCSLCCEELFISYWVKQIPECKNQPDRDKDSQVWQI